MLVLTRWFRRALVSGVCVAGLLGAGACGGSAGAGSRADHPAAGGAPDR